MARSTIAKRVLLVVLTLVMIFTSLSALLVGVSASDNKVLADSNTRRQALIDFAKSKSLGDMSGNGLEDLTYEDLTMIGVFLSNFYIPWSTSVGVTREEDQDKLTSDMVDALVKQCNFDEDTASALVPMIMSMSETTARELYVGEYSGGEIIGDAKLYVKDDYADNYIPNQNQASALSFLAIASGSFMTDKTPGTDNFAVDKKFALYWVDDADEKHIVWTNDCAGSVGGANAYFSASAIAYGMLCDSLNYAYGMGGNALFEVEDFTRLSSLSSTDQKKVLTENSLLYVDCFGNLICDMATDHVVFFPACINPYTWTDSNGENAGMKVNLINLFMLGEVNDNNVIYTPKRTDVGSSGASDEIGLFNYAFYTGSQSLFNLNYYRVYRGSSAIDLDTVTGAWKSLVSAFVTGGINSDETNTLCDIIDSKPWFNDDDSSEQRVYFPNWATYSSNLSDSAYGVDTESEVSASGSWVSPNSGKTYTNFDLPVYEDMEGDWTLSPPAGLDKKCYYHFTSGEYNGLYLNIDAFGNNGGDCKWTFGGVTWELDPEVDSGWNEMYADFADWCRVCEFGNTSYVEKSGYSYVKSPSQGYNGGFASSLYKGAYQDMIVIDDLGAFNSSDSDSSDILKSMNVFAEDGTSVTEVVNTVGGSARSFTGVGATNEVTKLNGSAAKPYLVSIYLAYVYAFFDEGTGADAKLSWKFNKAGLPQADSSNIDWSDIEIESDAQNQELMSLIYYILHPSKGIAVVQAWVKNKVGGVLVDWHEDMAGNASATGTTGTTKYIGFSGYVTVPALTDLSWTNWLLNTYDSLIIYFIIIMIVIMIGYTMVGSLSFQQALIGIVMFAFCAYIPPRAINGVVDYSNQVCDSIYGSKFTYWALVQHHQYLSDLNSAVSSGSEEQYLQTLFAQQAAEASDEYATVTVKWMCPKKDNYMARVQEQIEEDTGNTHVYKLISNLIRNQTSGESFSDTANSLYLYRSYTDIAQYSKYGYEVTKDKAKSFSTLTSIPNRPGTKKDWDTWVSKYKADSSETGDFGARKDGYLYTSSKTSTAGVGTTSKSRAYWHYEVVPTAKMYNDAIKAGSANATTQGLRKLTESNLEACTIGIPQKKINTLGLASLNDGTLDQGNMGYEYGSFTISTYNESPYYYFSYNLYDQLNQLTSTNAGNSVPYKDLLLGTNEDSYFYNMVIDESEPGYSELRDYMDMRGLFYVVIPYLKQANDVVVDWDEKRGLFLYDDVKVEFNADGTLANIPTDSKGNELDLDSEIGYKYWHNLNVIQLFNMYTPWVDTMYDCDYAKPETITVMGEKFYVSDPLDPTTYYKKDSNGNIIEGRPMVFSESEMASYGLTKSDLTQVELNIIKVNERCYSELLQVMDYFDFENDVLNTAAAMIETFEFNKVFSQTSLLGEDYVLYPQSYELKNFSYDAYLRLILAASTNESINVNNENSTLGQIDFYQNIVQNSSILTGIMLIFVDLFACYGIPALKLFFIVALFFLSIIMILAASIKLELKLSKVLVESLVAPLGKFLLVSIGMAFLVSLFMYNGNTAVTGRNNMTITLGDPVMVLLVMIIINAGVLVLYFKICKKVFKDCIKYTKSVATSIGGMVAGLGNGIRAGFKSGLVGGAAAVAGAGGLAYLAGKGIGKLKDKVSGTSRGTGAAASGDPGMRGAENTKNSPRINPKSRGGSSDDTPKLNKYDKKLAKGEAKVSTLTNKADINTSMAKDYRELARTQSGVGAGVRSKMYNAKANRLDKKSGKQIAKAESKNTKFSAKRERLEKKSELKHKKSNYKNAKRVNMAKSSKARQKKLNSSGKNFKA